MSYGGDYEFFVKHSIGGLLAFVSHDVEHHVVGFVHCFAANLGEVANAAVYVVVYDAFHRGHIFALRWQV